MVAVGTVLANVPWMDIIERAPGLLKRATLFVRSFRSGDTHVRTEAPDTASTDDRKEAAIAALQASVSDLEEDLRKAAALIEDMATAHAALVGKLAQARIALFGIGAVSAISISLSVLLWVQ
jgi:Tfp pilus assembly protein FimV